VTNSTLRCSGMGGEGDTKGLSESVFRENDIKQICNAGAGVEKGRVQVEERCGESV